MGIVIPLAVILLTCLLIWRACDGFELACEYIGRNLSEGVRGGTLNAISSSVPELLTTMMALFVLEDRDGFAIGIGTTSGSALFNSMIIPAACIFTVVGSTVMGVRVASVNVRTKVVLRDGIALIACEVILILLINGNSLHWWQGLVLMGMYIAYVAYMVLSMKPDASQADASQADGAADGENASDSENDCDSFMARSFYWVTFGPLMDLERIMVREKHRRQIANETWNGWPLLLVSTAVLGLACWVLVVACEWLGTPNESRESYSVLGYQFTGLGMPAMFVAVIFASMATSVPDTIISIRDARDGDYDDAVANAVGSNVFDICFALGFPMFAYTLIHGPIEMSDEVAGQSGELRLMLLLLTVIGFFIYYVGKRGVHPNGSQYVEMRRGKAVALLVLYLAFVGYIVARVQGNPLATSIAECLQHVLVYLPVSQ